MRLMMIDDDPTFLTVFSKTLTQKGHQVLTFEKPRHAIEDIQGNPEKYDAVFLDFRMPEMSGLEWLEKFRAAGHQHPVVLVSGQTDIEEAQDLVNLDLDAMLLKPFNSETLKKVLIKLETTCNSKETGHDSRSFPPESNETLAWKNEMVELLNESLKLWKKEYGDMTHLAQASGIWKLTQEKSGLRPRTLKRYLSLETLPMRPKWRQVIDTLNFVIKKSSSSRASSKLEKRKIKLEQTLTRLGLRHPYHSKQKAG